MHSQRQMRTFTYRKARRCINIRFGWLSIYACARQSAYLPVSDCHNAPLDNLANSNVCAIAHTVDLSSLSVTLN
jgi:hypothetical protein